MTAGKLCKLEQWTQLTAQLEATQEDAQATDEWLAVIHDHAQLEELDRPMFLRLMKRIDMGEKYEIAGENHRDIKIYSNFVGYCETLKSILLYARLSKNHF